MSKTHPTLYFISNIFSDQDFANWIPDNNYFLELIYKLVQVVDGVGAAPDFDPLGFDWRFHEFSNPIQLTLYSICIEIMALRMEPQEVGQRLFSLVTNIEATGIPIEVHDQPKVVFTLAMKVPMIILVVQCCRTDNLKSPSFLF